MYEEHVVKPSRVQAQTLVLGSLTLDHAPHAIAHAEHAVQAKVEDLLRKDQIAVRPGTARLEWTCHYQVVGFAKPDSEPWSQMTFEEFADLAEQTPPLASSLVLRILDPIVIGPPDPDKESND